MTYSIKPMHNYVLVVPDKGKTVERESGLSVAPDEDRVFSGVVAGVGPEVKISVAVGDRVLVPPYGVGKKMVVFGSDYMLYLDHEILGVFTG